VAEFIQAGGVGSKAFITVIVKGSRSDVGEYLQGGLGKSQDQTYPFPSLERAWYLLSLVSLKNVLKALSYLLVAIKRVTQQQDFSLAFNALICCQTLRTTIQLSV
jgi:hypothetical protein